MQLEGAIHCVRWGVVEHMQIGDVAPPLRDNSPEGS